MPECPAAPCRSRLPHAAAPIAILQTIGHRSLIALRDLTFGLALIAAVSYLPGSVTDDWSSPALRALVIAHDIRVLLHDLVWDPAPVAEQRPPPPRAASAPAPRAPPRHRQPRR